MKQNYKQKWPCQDYVRDNRNQVIEEHRHPEHTICMAVTRLCPSRLLPRLYTGVADQSHNLNIQFTTYHMIHSARLADYSVSDHRQHRKQTRIVQKYANRPHTRIEQPCAKPDDLEANQTVLESRPKATWELMYSCSM